MWICPSHDAVPSMRARSFLSRHRCNRRSRSCKRKAVRPVKDALKTAPRKSDRLILYGVPPHTVEFSPSANRGPDQLVDFRTHREYGRVDDSQVSVRVLYLIFLWNVEKTVGFPPFFAGLARSQVIPHSVSNRRVPARRSSAILPSTVCSHSSAVPLSVCKKRDPA